MASPNTAEQKKRISSDGLTTRPFQGLKNPLAESPNTAEPKIRRSSDGLTRAPSEETKISLRCIFRSIIWFCLGFFNHFCISTQIYLFSWFLSSYPNKYFKSQAAFLLFPLFFFLFTRMASRNTPVRPTIRHLECLTMASIAFAESSSSSGRNGQPYDVFINHHGQDTKRNLAQRIYTKLNETGLRVFLDTHELELGNFFPKDLKNAIASADIHIAIFSKNYAKSFWCLEELALILTLQREVIFIPIFYDVEPSTLRWASGIYADAFNEHEKKNRYIEKLQSWKEALHKASLYTGEIINNQGDEEASLMNVVNCVLKELKKVRLDVAQHPVGLEEVEEDFHKNIVLQSIEGSIQIVGIYGMGGIGKTTFAKHFYNKKCSTFNNSSFLFDIREAASKGQLHEKQKKLLQDLNLKGENAKFDNMHEGKQFLRSRLKSASVLIVLDDVDHEDQLDALLPARDNLGHGSLIIVTTRELCVLRRWGISALYKIKTLNHSHAKELFNWHAFEQPSPSIDFKELAEKFVAACCGLPLSLKVLGSLLCGESNKEYWQSQLDKLYRIVPEDIESRLKISYNALDDEEKEMFLDVACFFIGWPSSRAIAVWDGSNWSGLHGWDRLKNKCLVELGKDNNIKMHDHLRDLGREIANKQSPYRLWSKQQIIKIRPQQVSIQIRGMADAVGDNCLLQHDKIILNTSEGERILALRSLGLKIFIGEGGFISEECREFSRELLCFHCVGFAHKNLPSWFPLKKLRILNILKPQNLEDLWECDEDAPLQLRQLIIDEGFELRGTKLKKISHLQSLTSLETLRIDVCTELKTLPSLAGATSLKEIQLRCCYKLEKIDGLESLRSLETLRIHFCRELKTLPNLAKATSLKEIELKNCKQLEKIESLESLRSLETLRFDECRKLKTLPSLAGATSLKEIELRMCSNLEKIESLQGVRSLETLQIYICHEFQTLPSLADATSLKKIELTYCWKLEKIESFESLRSLETLQISGCPLKTLPSLADATSLKKIKLTSCQKLEKIESLERLRSLETLGIDACRELKTLPSLAEATSLKQIDLSKCIKLEKIESLERLRSLETLGINECTELKTLPSLAEATSLKNIYLNKCTKLEKIESFESLSSLETFIIYDCTELKTLPRLAGATSLKKIKLIGCTKLNILPSPAELTCLEEFELQKCPKLEKVEDLNVLTSLKRLKVHMWSMGACVMLKLNERERLELVEVGGNKVVVEPGIQKWPREVKILTRAVIDEMPVRNFFTSHPATNGVEASWSPETLTFCMPESSDDANAILICFIVRSIQPNLTFHVWTESIVTCFSTEISNGGSVWVWMGIFPQQSYWLSSPEYVIAASDENHCRVKVEKGWLMRGREQSIRQAFTQLSQS